MAKSRAGSRRRRRRGGATHPAGGGRARRRERRSPDNAEIAAALREVADLLELQGANPFRVRAYRNGARTVEDLTRPVSELVAAGEDLTNLPTIGEDLASYIEELVRTGRLGILEEARESVPGSVAELLRLGGVGPKRAIRFYRELGVSSVEELERALKGGEVARLPGFGERSAERLLRAIEDYRKHTERYKLSDADRLVAPLVAYLKEAPGLEELDVAGSYRRRVETIGDLDLLAVGEPAGPIMEHFTDFPQTMRVELAGPTRGTIVLRSGLRVDLRIVPRASYGAALHYFTGSKAHNIKIRTLGIERGLRISEYGVFREVEGGGEGPMSGERVGGAREDDVFEAVGLPWIPPEIREDRGEIEAARAGKLPKLITLRDIRGDLQMHSRWSDGTSSIEEMARAGLALGYEYIAITDHSVAIRVARGLRPEQLEEQWREIDEVRERVPGIRILRGLEIDILHDGSLDIPDEYLERLDLVLVAVHSRFGLSKKEMTDRIIKGISHPGVHILAHPTGRLINAREPYEVDLEAVLEAATEVGVAVELNAHPDRLDLSDVQVRRAKEVGVKVAINTDAHSAETLGYMKYGVDQARRGWLEARDVLNCMTWKRLEKWLSGRRRR